MKPLFLAALLATLAIPQTYPDAPKGMLLKCEQSAIATFTPMRVLVCGIGSDNVGDYAGAMQITFDDGSVRTYAAKASHVMQDEKKAAYAVIAFPLFDQRKVVKAEFYPEQATASWIAP